MSKYKKNDITIVILSALTLLLIGAFVYLNFSEKESNEELDNSNKEIEYSDISTNEEIIYIFSDVLEENYISNIAILERDIENFDDLTNIEKLDIAYKMANIEANYIYENGFSADLINNYFDRTFYDNITWNKDDIICDICGEILFIYDSENNKYIYNENHLGHGTSYADNYYSKIIEIKNNENTYIVTEVKLWNVMDIDSTLLFAFDTYKNSRELVYPLFSIDNNNYEKIEDQYSLLINELEENFDDYKDNMARYTYTFEKTDDKYLLVSFEFEDR